MRVAVVFYGLAPEGGGVHTFQRSLLTELRARRDGPHEFVPYTAGTGPQAEPGVIAIPAGLTDLARRRGLQVVRAAQDRLNLPRRATRTWFERSLAGQRIDFVWFAANWAEDCDVPFLFTLFDLGHLLEPHFPELSHAGEWERRQHHFERNLHKATAVIVPNAAGTRQVVKHYAVEEERVLELAHPTPGFALDPPAEDASVLDRHGLRDKRYLFYPAQFWAHKNHFGLLRALGRLDGYDVALVGSDKGQLDHVRSLAAELGVRDRVHVLGFVETAEMVALYRHAHALVYLSFLGPENLPPLEAFALGCPVVSADIPGAREQLGDAALLVAPTDPDAAAAAVRRLEDAAERERHVAAGRERAARFTASGYVQGVIDFLDRFEPVRRCWA